MPMCRTSKILYISRLPLYINNLCYNNHVIDLTPLTICSMCRQCCPVSEFLQRRNNSLYKTYAYYKIYILFCLSF